MAEGQKVGSIYAQFDVDNKGAVQVMDQTQKQAAKSALETHKALKVKVDLAEWKKLSNQLGALQARAMGLRKDMLKATPGSDEAKKLTTELKNLEAKMRQVKAVTEPMRKELERLAKAKKEAADAGGSFKSGSDIASGLAEKIPGFGGAAGAMGSVLAPAAMSQPAIMAVVAALALMAAQATAAGLAIKGLADITRDAVEATGQYAEEVLNLSAKTGIGTDQLQQFKYVADVAGISFEGLTRGVTMLERKMIEIGKGSGAGADALARLGISARDANGEFKSMDVLFPQIISKLQGIGNVTERNALASQLFGRGWAEVAPIIGMSAGNLNDLMAEAKKLGVVLDSKELQQAAELDDQFDRLKQAAAGLFRQLGSAVTPTLLETVEDITADLPGYIDDAKQAFAKMQPYIKEFADAFGDAYQSAKPLMEKLLQLGAEEITGAMVVASESIRVIADALATAQEWGDKLLNTLNSIREFFGLGPIIPDEVMGRPGGGAASNSGTGGSAADDLAAGAELAEQVTQRLDEMKREMYLNGDATAYTAMKWETLNGQFKEATAEQKNQLLTAAQSKDAQDSARKATEDNAKSAIEDRNKQIDAIRDQFKAEQDLARKRAETMRSAAAEVVDIVKDQIRKEKDAKDQAIDDDKSRYEKLAELGRAGAIALTNVKMFAKKSGADVTAKDYTDERIRSAAKEMIGKRQGAADISGLVQKRLYGDAIQRYENAANAKGPDFEGMKQTKSQLDTVIKYVSDIPRVVAELKEIRRPTSSGGVRER
jgi:hypothetical protein